MLLIDGEKALFRRLAIDYGGLSTDPYYTI